MYEYVFCRVRSAQPGWFMDPGPDPYASPQVAQAFYSAMLGQATPQKCARSQSGGNVVRKSLGLVVRNFGSLRE